MPRKGLFREQAGLVARFARLTRQNPKLYALSMIFLIVASLLEGVSMGLVIPFLDLLFHQGQASVNFSFPLLDRWLSFLPAVRFRYAFMGLLGLILAATVIKNALIFFSNLITSRLCRDTEHLLRTRIFDRYLTFSKTFFDENKVGGLYDLAISQVMLASEIFYQINSFALNLFMAAVYFALMLTMSWQLTMISLLMLPCFYFITRIIASRVLKSTQRRFELDQEMSAFLYDALSNITLIRSYTNEKEESERYRTISDASRRTFHSIWKKILFMPHVQEVTLSVFMAILIAACVFIFLKSRLAGMAVLLSFFVVLRRFSLNLNQLGARFAEVARAMTPVRQVLWIFSDEDKQFLQDGSKRFEGLRESITFRDVRFRYGAVPILNEVDLRFEKGRMTALVGPSGAGKTTIVNLLTRFYDVSSGSVLFDGVDVRDFELASLRRKISIVDQNVAILNTSIRSNIVYGLGRKVTDAELEDVARKAYLTDLVRSHREGFDTLVGDHGVRLSGGEKQRIAIARAILKDPEIFIFDEATSLLDMETELHIQKAIESLTHGRTVIAIAHRLSTVRNADRIYVIENGKVSEQGKFEELIRGGGRFQRYWELQGIR